MTALRDALEEAYDEIDTEDSIDEGDDTDEIPADKIEEEQKEETPEEVVETPEEEPVDEPVELQEEVEKPVEVKPETPAPQSWSGSMKEKWADLPADVQSEISRREADIHRMMTSHDGELRMGREMKDVINPYMPMLNSLGASPAQAVNETLNIAYVLNNGQPQQKAQVISELIQRHGIDMNLMPTGEENPQLVALQQQVAQLSQQANPNEIENKVRMQIEAERVQNEVQAFAANPQNTHYHEVKAAMAALLDSGAAQGMQEAYDMACRAHPTISSTIIDAELQQREAKRKEELSAKKKAAASVTGSSGKKSNPSSQPKSTREALESAWDELESETQI